MKKYVSPELNVELFNVVDVIMESEANAIDFPGGTPTINDNPDGFGDSGFSGQGG